jgi:hypothetical protein
MNWTTISVKVAYIYDLQWKWDKIELLYIEVQICSSCLH